VAGLEALQRLAAALALFVNDGVHTIAALLVK
jgi:hypothetical protein